MTAAPMLGRRTLVSAMPALALAGWPAFAEQSKFTLGTAAEGGGYIIYGVALIEALKQADPTLEVRTKSTSGANENVKLLEAGEIDLAMVPGEIVHDLLLEKARSANKLTVITAMSPAPSMFAVRSSSRFRGIADLVGRRIVWSPRETSLVGQARLIMDGLGLDIDEDFEPIYPEHFSDGPPMVIDGRAAALWGTGYRWPGFVQIADASGGARFVAPNAAEIARIREKYPFLSELTVPASLYRGQYDAIQTIGTWSFILARPELEDTVGYRLAADLHKLERTHGLTKHLVDTTAKNTLAAISGPDVLQPGVAKYYQKAGLL